MHLCGVANDGYATLQVPPLCGERSASAAARSAVGWMLLLGGVLTVSASIEITTRVAQACTIVARVGTSPSIDYGVLVVDISVLLLVGLTLTSGNQVAQAAVDVGTPGVRADVVTFVRGDEPQVGEA